MTTEELMRYVQEPSINLAFHLTSLCTVEGRNINYPLHIGMEDCTQLIHSIIEEIEEQGYDIETINWNVSLSGDTLYFLCTDPLRH